MRIGSRSLRFRSRPTPKAALRPTAANPPPSLLSTAPRPTPSLTSAARPTCARGWSGCSSLRPSIRAACSWPAECGASPGGSTGSEFESLLAQFELLRSRFTAPKSLERMHLGAVRHSCASWAAIPIRASRSPSAQPARSRLGLRAVSIARGCGALCRRGAQAVSAAPLHRRSRARSQPPRLRLLRDEDVPRPLLQGLHRRALRRRGRRGRELSGHARRKPAGHAAYAARRGLGQS